MVMRLVEQKGIDLVEQAFPELIRLPLQIVLLGAGEAKYEAFFREVSLTYAQKVSAYIGYDEELAHWITAGSDMYLMPSRFEPCGLNQMYSLQYGTVPIVRQTGGLADTVHDVDTAPDSGNGFAFAEYHAGAMLAAVRRALALFEQDKPRWKQLMKRGMKADFSWHTSARRYLDLYQKAAKKRPS
jgi:starch synthase